MSTNTGIRAEVLNRGAAPSSFIGELVQWARKTPEEIFAPNAEPVEIYTVIKSSLGTLDSETPGSGKHYVWNGPLHRKAALLEAMRVHAGLESSWNWTEGVDVTNARSRRNKRGEEAGIFQVSFDSTDLCNGVMRPFAQEHNIMEPEAFIHAMKGNHALALEYYARLVRHSISWAGPLIRNGPDSIYPWLRLDAMQEFLDLLR
jgi:hypothetical protein